MTTLHDNPAFRFAAGLGFLFAATLALTLVFALPLYRYPGHVFNSDLIQPFLVVADALADPGSLFDWRHAPSPYVVPDMLLAALCLLLPIPELAKPVVYCGALLALDCLAIGWLLVAAGRTRTVLAGALAATVALMALYGLAMLLSLEVSFNMLVSVPAPFIHSGAILMGVAFIAAMIAYLRAPERRNLVPAILICAAGGYSDVLFTIWFVAPLVAALLLLGRRTAAKTIDLLLVTAIGVVAMVIDRVMRPSIAIIKIDHATTIGTWVSSFVRAIEIGAWPFPATVLMAVVMAGRALYLLLARRRALSAWNIVEICLGGAQLSATLLPVVSGTLIHIESLRYALAAFVVPIIWLLGWACRPTLPLRWAVGLPAAIAVAVTIAVAPAGFDAASRAGTPKPLLACLEANGLTTGLSDYWNAKLSIFQSSYRLHLMQLNETTALPWAPNFNVRWFSRRAADGAIAEPNFIVLTGLPEAEVLALYGAPQSTLDCGGETVWRYDHTLALPPIEGV